ncbi:ATP-dependent sacrificial sulfur transferase LarE [Caproiciproducens galactitolivorans]|uniref:ATP-dependent sacrificial sulfur transferase LarE n=1 Tax=Caproiciproducens galactitolivorans TaxID=642589 RepID=A0ABT4BQY2_9FIRM|nr:ATP-dependent sacrificial sulfur transferase LarE [Caproiciproducens galactitolivorans]MCY1713301.1 ATP-dependent sacrificial sulfur transferase LarE [Caproiciproducens galactitolivorans]
MDLKTFFSQNPRAALAFSGGVDSSYLLYAAKHYGCAVHAYFIHSAFQPQFELDDARRLAEELGVPLTVAEVDVLKSPQVAANDPLRCYYCKTALFTQLLELAKKDGCPLLMDGTNASDLADDRPGMRALKELGVRSPLRECGLTKPEIRRLSKEAGLFTYDKPAYACLATRIPTGTKITSERLDQVAKGEAILFSMGFTDFRVRYFHNAAKIQLPESQFPMALLKKEELTRELSRWFDGVLLDLTPRGGKEG